MASCQVSPESMSAILGKPDSTVQMLTLTNSGEAELTYNASVSLEEPRQSEVPYQVFKKDEPATRVAAGQERGSGGPDAFGYTWVDSDDPNGPTYEWVEINGIGTNAGGGDDSNLGPFNLGFEFPWYGSFYNSVRICTNGWLSFTSTSTVFSNQGIPNSSQPNNLLALLWDDLTANTGGNIYYYQDLANERFIVEFDAVDHYGTPSPETFQVIINANGSVVYQYKTVTDVDGCTVGTENAAGNDGLEIVFNGAYLHDELAILIEAEPLPEPWVKVVPRMGSIGAMSSGELEVTFNSQDVEIGTYSGTINIETNDPENGFIQIPVSLTVTDELSGVDEQELPSVVSLGGAYPNPFNPATNIKFATPRTGHVSLKIYDLAGRHVRTLVDGRKDAGYHNVMWDGTDQRGRGVASGAYYYRLQTDGFDQTQKMLLLK